MKARGAVAYAVGLIAFLCLGLWLGGHPAKLPEFIREHVVDSPAALTAEAAEVLEDNYYRPVGATELGNSSLQGMVRELRKRHREDRFTEYFSPESLESFNQQIEGRFSGVGISVVPVKRGLRAVKVFAGSPLGPGSRLGTRSSPSTANRSPARAAMERPKRSRARKGPRSRSACSMPRAARFASCA